MEDLQPALFEIPENKSPKRYFRQLRYPVWTENKANLIARYLYYFVLVTKHGTYLDAFAGPQKPEEPGTWAAKLATEIRPPWIRHFHLFEKKPKQISHLNSLEDAFNHSDKGASKRTINVHPGDFNQLIRPFLETHPFSEKEACFCLLDQRTFECHWASITALAKYKKDGWKIELFYFLPNAWLDRAISAVKSVEILKKWWGRDDWEVLRGIDSYERANRVTRRIEKEFGYRSVMPYPIFEKKSSGRIMYFMIHATDHKEAPNLMMRAYHTAVREEETTEQFKLDFNKWKSSNIKAGENGGPVYAN